MGQKSYVSVDIETTGLSPAKDRIIEIGAAKVVEGEIVESFHELVDPQIELSDRIIGLTGITDEMLYGRREISSVIKDFVLFSEELPLLGHNIIFDYSFLKTAAAKEELVFERYGFDTLFLCRTLHSELESKSLEFMCQHYGIKNEQQHRAYHDAVATHELFQALITHKDVTTQMFVPKPLFYRIPKIEPMTAKQKNYLMNLLKYHKIETRQSIETLTKSEASRLIDKIILKYGRI